MDFSSKLAKLRDRRIPYDLALESFSFAKALRGDNEVYSRINESKAIKYALGAMQPIDHEYTENSYKEGDRIKNQLEQKLPLKGIMPDFRYQGSVTSDTHIKSHSDIDLLVIHDAFYAIEPPQKLSPLHAAYMGDPLEDLITLRTESASILKSSFPAVTVDESGSKSITLTGGSLKRKIDVVSSNWYNTNLYAQTAQEYHRGVMILDIGTRSRPKNLPFLHNRKIDDKDRAFSNNLRKSIRLIKSMKYDSDKDVKVSSYDIAALAYCMPDRLLSVSAWHELMLVDNCVAHLATVIVNEEYRESLYVPDGSRKIFGNPGATVEGVTLLFSELYDLKKQIEIDLAETSRTINRAAIYY